MLHGLGRRLVRLLLPFVFQFRAKLRQFLLLHLAPAGMDFVGPALDVFQAMLLQGVPVLATRTVDRPGR